MRKIYIALVTVAILTCMGCADVVELTETESTVIAQYAASTTLKYDKKYSKNMLRLSSLEEDEELIEEEETIESDNSDGNIAEGISAEDNIANTENEEVPRDIASILGISEAKITYTGYEINEQYPMENSSEYIAKPIEGNKLLVLKFDVINEAEGNKLIEVLSLSPKFIVRINGEEGIRSLETLVVNDLTTMCVELEAGETTEEVLIFEVSEELSEDMIETISLDVDDRINTSNIEMQ